MRHLLWLALCAFLISDVSGATELFTPEPCPAGVSDTQPDGACPATCVRCSCCAQPAVYLQAGIEELIQPVSPVPDVPASIARTLPPLEVTHIPKSF
jgi:hypothetical protein